MGFGLRIMARGQDAPHEVSGARVAGAERRRTREANPEGPAEDLGFGSGLSVPTWVTLGTQSLRWAWAQGKPLIEGGQKGWGEDSDLTVRGRQGLSIQLGWTQEAVPSLPITEPSL